MNLFFRLLFTSLFSKLRKPVSVLGPCVTPFRCYPSDLDVIRHMNNGKYFSLLDLARVDLMTRSGLKNILSQNGWYPVVAAETIRFKKSIQVFQKFDVETCVVGWDEKAFILRQRFLSKDTVIAEAIVRARFLKKSGGSVSPADILAIGGVTSGPPTMEPWVSAWNQNQI